MFRDWRPQDVHSGAMDNLPAKLESQVVGVDRWLKSLRLHKYTYLFNSLTYEDMLNLEEQFLVDMDITKGARNKIMVSIKKLNRRQDQLVYMIDDLNQGSISLKEALSTLKDMLVTPIPRPYPSDHAPSPTISITDSESSGISVGSGSSHDNGSTADGPSNDRPLTTRASAATNITSTNNTTMPTGLGCNIINNNGSNPQHAACTLTASSSPPSTKATNSPIHYNDPYDLTHLFVDTFERVAQRLIESPAHEDAACHGIMAAIVDECLKHNSFTNGQKARIACCNQTIFKEQQHQHQQKVRMARFNHLPATAREQKAKVARFKQLIVKEQRARMFKQHQNHEQQQPHQEQQQQPQHHKPQLQQPWLVGQFHQQLNHSSLLSISTEVTATATAAVAASTVTASTAAAAAPTTPTVSSNNTAINDSGTRDARRHPFPYREYSLLGPGLTFELPCLRAKVGTKTEAYNQNQLSPSGSECVWNKK